ncbi:MAG TPA: DsrE/DsrF/DrsH-like family protein [Methanomassiliicoccales archaeon]|nr:DsrE/DsrF/DrsH-like family protein [Methanomassiliicoccales archaeon]
MEDKDKAMMESLKGADRVTIVVHSGDMDKMYSTLIIGTGALSWGMEVSLYFTFWGLQRLQKGGLDKGPLSKMNMLGLGRRMIKGRMKKANVAELEHLFKDFKELGGRVIACEMTMEVMGITKSDLREDLIDEYGAVGTYIRDARESNITLFI